MKYLLAILLATTLLSCQRPTDPMAEYDVDIYTPRYAEGFKITGTDDRESILLTVSNPWQGADSVAMCLMIARNGESAPQGFTGKVIEGEAKRIVAMSSSHIAMLDAIDAVDRIVGVSGIDYITNEDIIRRRDEVGDVGYEANINYELLVALDPDLVLLYGVNGASPMEGKLDQLNIPYIYIGDYLESTPLGKAEWLVALGEIVGKRSESQQYFDNVTERYEGLRQRVAEQAIGCPSVMVNIPYSDSWFIPSTDSYVSRLINDAGAQLVCRDFHGNTSGVIDVEKAWQLTSQADMWLDTGTARSLDDIAHACPRFTDTRCYKEGRVYNNNLRSTPQRGNDYYESGIVNPDIVLRDLVSIFHPELGENQPVYYQQLK